MKNKDLKAIAIVEVENTRKFFETGMHDVLSSITEVFSQMKNSLEVDLTTEDNEIKNEVFKRIKLNLDSIKTQDVKVFDSKNVYNTEDIFGKSSKKWIIEIKESFAYILKSYYEATLKFITLQNQSADQKIKWQSTLDQVIKSHEGELLNKEKIIESLRNNISILNSRIATLEQDKYNITLLKDKEIEVLSKENNKKINVNMLKSVLIKIFTTNDLSIQDKVLPVVYSALKFSEIEINEIKAFRKKENSFLGFLGK